MWAREKESTTGIGEGIAIPHAKTAAVKTPAIAFGRSKAGIDLDSLDGNNVHLFFMIAASAGENNTHLETLSKLSTFLLDEQFRARLMEASNEDAIIQLFVEKEQEDEAKEEEETTSSNRKKIIAVTGCPTGIANTYMAADS